jgi:hypothetical protein
MLTLHLLQAQLFVADVVKSFSDHDITRACGDNSFFGFPRWYKYLHPQVDAHGDILDVQGHAYDPSSPILPNCAPVLSGINGL